MIDIDVAKKLLDTSAEKNRNLLIAFMAYLATATILALSITDKDLLIDEKTIQLPLLSVGLPMWAFYTVIPLILLLLHFDVLQNVQEHNKKLDAWLALQSDEEKAKAGEQLFPYILDFARVRYGLEATPSMASRLVAVGAWMMYVYLPLLVFALFFIRFADLQGVGTSVYHLVLGAVDIFLLILFWRQLRGVGQAPLPSARWLSRLGLGVQAFAVAWVFVLWFCIQLAHFWHYWFSKDPTKDEAAIHAVAPAWLTDTIKLAIDFEKKIGAIAIVPRIVVTNTQPYQVKDDNIRLQKWLEPNKAEKDLWEASPRPLDWSNRRLAFADLGYSTLRRVNLAGADLQGASLGDAQLQGANLRETQLQGAGLWSAQLQGADL